MAKDPTVRSDSSAQASEGANPAPKVEEADHHAGQKKYRDNPDKPNPSTVAQVEDVPKDWPGQGVQD